MSVNASKMFCGPIIFQGSLSGLCIKTIYIYYILPTSDVKLYLEILQKTTLH